MRDIDCRGRASRVGSCWRTPCWLGCTASAPRRTGRASPAHCRSWAFPGPEWGEAYLALGRCAEGRVVMLLRRSGLVGLIMGLASLLEDPVD